MDPIWPPDGKILGPIVAAIAAIPLRQAVLFVRRRAARRRAQLAEAARATEQNAKTAFLNDWAAGFNEESTAVERNALIKIAGLKLPRIRRMLLSTEHASADRPHIEAVVDGQVDAYVCEATPNQCSLVALTIVQKFASFHETADLIFGAFAADADGPRLWSALYMRLWSERFRYKTGIDLYLESLPHDLKKRLAELDDPWVGMSAGYVAQALEGLGPGDTRRAAINSTLRALPMIIEAELRRHYKRGDNSRKSAAPEKDRRAVEGSKRHRNGPGRPGKGRRGR